MNSAWPRRLTRLATLALVAPLAACIVVPVGHGRGGYYRAEGAAVGGEVVVAPAPGLVWIAPGWGWVGGRRAWQEGHWGRR